MKPNASQTESSGIGFQPVASANIARWRTATVLFLALFCTTHADDKPSSTYQREAERHPFEGFTQPFRTIHVAASDTGRVAEVKIKRGEKVKAGQLLLRLDSSILETTRRVAAAEAEATAKINGLTVQHKIQKTRYEQYKALVESGRGTTEELRRAEADEQVALFNLQAAEEEQHKNKLALAEIDARIQARSVVSPVDGIVTKVVREVGEFVSPSQPEVVTVVQLHKIRASFYLPTPSAVRFRKSEYVTIALDETDQIVHAIVEVVAATTEADSGRVRVDTLIDNHDGRFRSGLRSRLMVFDSTKDRPAIAKHANRPNGSSRLKQANRRTEFRR